MFAGLKWQLQDEGSDTEGEDDGKKFNGEWDEDEGGKEKYPMQVF